MILRDYHAENVLYLPDRSGPAHAGLLDFQDAMVGHRAYDLVSLLHDIRRDVGQVTQDACIARYVLATGVDRAAFEASFYVLGAQRNLRILGVFARLATEHGKTRYLDLLPAVWRQLQTELAHPVLAPLADVLNHVLPIPDTDLIARLRSQCPTP
jgi:aminoglycoside/choline kinase family phosphotransferase